MHKPKDSAHHRKCKSNGGKKIAQNISMVTVDKHRAWHLLFGNHTPTVIASIINHTWLDPEWELVARKKGG